MEPHLKDFDYFYSSDLKRCHDTAFYALGFPNDESLIKQERALREIHFGTNEGLHYDNLPDKEKEEIASPTYIAPAGEGWQDVSKRSL